MTIKLTLPGGMNRSDKHILNIMFCTAQIFSRMCRLYEVRFILSKLPLMSVRHM
jgi:hypothetical protein